MATNRKDPRKPSKLRRTLGWLNPKSPAKKLLVFVLVFSLIGGSYMAYNSFAATSSVITKICYNPGSPNAANVLVGKIAPYQYYSISYRKDLFVKPGVPTWIAAEGQANVYGDYATSAYVSNTSYGGYYYLYVKSGTTYTYKGSVWGGSQCYQVA